MKQIAAREAHRQNRKLLSGACIFMERTNLKQLRAEEIMKNENIVMICCFVLSFQHCGII